MGEMVLTLRPPHRLSPLNGNSRGTSMNAVVGLTEVISALREHERELRKAGIRHLSLFGSVARGEADANSDIDLTVELDPQAHLGLFGLIGLQHRLTEILGRKVDLLPEPIEHHRIRQNIEKDRLSAF
jgi:uncharacterized protein